MDKVTIIMPVSRSTYLSRIFPRLELLDCDREKTNLLTYVDGPLELFQQTRNFTVNSKFKERLCVYRKKGQPNVGSVKRRRQRIADIHNEIKEYLQDSDYIFLIEDDGLLPLNSLKKLLYDYSIEPDAGLISGVELGRWGYLHIGAWALDDIYDPSEIITPRLGEGLQKIDAVGLYCCLTKKENYIKHVFKPYLEILGPDVDFGVELRKQGFMNYIDYNIHCKHLSKEKEIPVYGSTIVRVRFIKNSNVRFGWEQTAL